MKHSYHPEVYYSNIGPHRAVLAVNPGDTITTTTLNAAGWDEQGNKTVDFINPVTGPFCVNSANKGDTLSVSIEEVSVTSHKGYSLNVLDLNAVTSRYSKKLPNRSRIFWKIDDDGIISLEDKSLSVRDGFSLHVQPMIGTIGVAPEGNQYISTETGGNYGGNLDYQGICQGARIYFPVFMDGAFLFVGDGHAIQGDGELLGTGVEVSLQIRFSVDVLKKTIKWPRGENGETVFTIGMGRPLDEALRNATTEMVDYLKGEYLLSEVEAQLLIGQTAQIAIGNFCNPSYSVICKISKKYLR
jgi:amidase